MKRHRNSDTKKGNREPSPTIGFSFRSLVNFCIFSVSGGEIDPAGMKCRTAGTENHDRAGAVIITWGLKSILRHQPRSQFLKLYKTFDCSVCTRTLQLVNESSRLTIKTYIKTMKKQRRERNRYNVLRHRWRSLVCQTTPLEI